MTYSIYPIPILTDNYVWAIVNDKQQAIIVDPGEAQPVLDVLSQKNWQLQAILVTHKHWDHTNGITDIVKKFPVPVYGPKDDYVASVTHPLVENDTVEISNFPRLKVLAIPGHTLGHIAYYGDELLFCGDTLFAAGCGRVFEGTPKQMLATLEKLASLPAATKIYCGHEYTLNNLRFAETVEPANQDIQTRKANVSAVRQKNQASLPSNLQIEKETNPFLRCNIPQVIKSAENHAEDKLTDNVAVFGVLREWKNNFQ